MDVAEARSLVLGLPGVSEHDHFGRAAYRATRPNGKPSAIFMTLWIEEQRAVLMLATEQQIELHAHHPEQFFPVPNKWGAKGATFVELSKVNAALLRTGLDLAVAKVLGT